MKFKIGSMVKFYNRQDSLGMVTKINEQCLTVLWFQPLLWKKKEKEEYTFDKIIHIH